METAKPTEDNPMKAQHLFDIATSATRVQPPHRIEKILTNIINDAEVAAHKGRLSVSVLVGDAEFGDSAVLQRRLEQMGFNVTLTFSEPRQGRCFGFVRVSWDKTHQRAASGPSE